MTVPEPQVPLHDWPQVLPDLSEARWVYQGKQSIHHNKEEVTAAMWEWDLSGKRAVAGCKALPSLPNLFCHFFVCPILASLWDAYLPCRAHALCTGSAPAADGLLRKGGLQRCSQEAQPRSAAGPHTAAPAPTSSRAQGMCCMSTCAYTICHEVSHLSMQRVTWRCGTSSTWAKMAPRSSSG